MSQRSIRHGVILGLAAFVGLAGAAFAQTVPPAPSGVTASLASQGRVIIRWQDLSDLETGFVVIRNPAFPTGDYIVSADLTGFVDRPGRGQYSYTIVAFNDVGRSAGTTSGTVAFNGGQQGAYGPLTETSGGGGGGGSGIPSAPSNVRAVGGTGSIQLSWRDRSSNETGFEINRETSIAGSWLSDTTFTTAANTIAYTDPADPATYRYRLRAFSAVGFSSYTGWVICQSSSGTQNPPPAPPAAPSAAAASDVGSGRAMFSWSDNSSDETSFVIERNPAFASGQMTVASNATSFVDQCGDGAFSYRVKAMNDNGSSAFTSWAAVSVSSGSSGGTGGTGGSGGTSGSGSGGTTCGGGLTGGWTVFNEAANTHKVYVSSSTGTDSNPGTQDAPVRTLAAGYGLMRDGYPDWLLLKCGDTWHERLPAWNKSGASATDIMLISSYGDGGRPTLMTGSTDCWRSANSSLSLNNIAIVGLHMVADTWTGVGADAPVGVYMLRNGENLLVEDCLIEKYANNIVVQGYPTTFTNAQIRRCVLSDPFRTDTGDTNIYVENVNGILFEENVVSNLQANDAAGNQISHNVYIQETCAPNSAIVRGNIIYNGRTNLTVRCGGRIEDNLAIRGGQGIAIGYNVGTPAYVPAVVRGNVITESRNHWNGQLLGLGICFDYVDGVDCSNNIIYHGTDGGYHVGIMVNGNNKAIDVANNVVYDWQQSGGSPCAFQVVTTSLTGPITVHDNQFQQPTWGQLVWNEGGVSSVVAYSNNKEHAAIARPFYDSSYLSFTEWQAAHEATANSNVPAYFDVSRNPGAYNAILGGEASTEGFILAARRQSHAAWRTDYTADAFNNYVRGGFNMVMGTP